jgi:hypothetical protein
VRLAEAPKARFASRARRLLTLALIAVATPALAQSVLPIDGIFGNATGCTYFATGQVTGDDLLLLTPDTFASVAIGCDFVALTETTGQSFIVAAICSSDDAALEAIDEVIVSDRGRDGYFVRLAGMEEWGPLLPCQNFLGTGEGGLLT